MKIPKPVSKIPIDVSMNSTKIQAEISIITKISESFDFFQIIVYQIYVFFVQAFT